MDLASLRFKVDSKELEDTIQKIDAIIAVTDKLTTANTNLKKSGGTTAKSYEELAAALKKAQEKLAEFNKGENESGQAGDKTNKVLERQISILAFMTQGFSKGQSSALAMAKALGATDDELKQLGETLDKQRALIGGDAFDKSTDSLKRLKNELRIAREVTANFGQAGALTGKELKDLGRDIERVTQLYTSQGQSVEFIKKATDSLSKEFAENAAALRQEFALQDKLQSELTETAMKEKLLADSIRATRIEQEALNLQRQGYSRSAAVTGATAIASGLTLEQVKPQLDAIKASKDYAAAERDKASALRESTKAQEQAGDAAKNAFITNEQYKQSIRDGINDIFKRRQAQKDLFNQGVVSKTTINEIERLKAAFRELGTPEPLIKAKINEFRMLAKEADAAGARLQFFANLRTQVFAGIGGAALGVAGIAGAVAAGIEATKTIVTLSDNIINLRSRLTAVSENTIEFNKEFANMTRIAVEARAPFEQVSTLFARLVPVMPSLGKGTREAGQVTEAFSKILLLSGTRAAETSSALIQLSQALAKGKLDGDEFRSVAENAPEVLRLLEKSLGKTRGELYEMSEQGKLTAGVIVNVLQASLAGLDEKLQGLPVTAEQAFNILKTQFTDFILSVQGAEAGTGVFADIMLFASDVIKEGADILKSFSGETTKSADDVDLLAIALSGVIEFFKITALVASDIVYTFKGVGREIGIIAAQAVALASGNFAGVRAIREEAVREAEQSRKDLDDFQKRINEISDKALSNRALRQAQETKKQAQAVKQAQSSIPNEFVGARLGTFDKSLKTEENLLAKHKDTIIGIEKALISEQITLENQKNEQLSIIQGQSSEIQKKIAQNTYDQLTQKQIENNTKSITLQAAANKKFKEESDKLNKTVKGPRANNNLKIERDNELQTLKQTFTSEIGLIKEQEKTKADLLKDEYSNRLISLGEFTIRELQITEEAQMKQLQSVQMFQKKLDSIYGEQATDLVQRFEQQRAKNRGNKGFDEAKLTADLANELTKLSNAYVAATKGNEDLKKGLENQAFERQTKSANQLRGELLKLDKQYADLVKSEEKLLEERNRQTALENQTRNLPEEQAAAIRATADEQARLNGLLEKLKEDQLEAFTNFEAANRVIVELQEKSLSISPEQQKALEASIVLLQRASRIRNEFEEGIDTKAATEGTRAFTKVVKDQEDELRKGLTDSVVTALVDGGKEGGKKLRDILKAQLRQKITVFIDAIVQNVTGLGGKSGSSGGGIIDTLLGGSSGGLTGAFQSAFPIASSAFSAFGTSFSAGLSSAFTSFSTNIAAGVSSVVGGNIAAGFGTLAGTLGPYALAAIALYNLLKSKGGPKTESGFTTSDFQSFGFSDSLGSSTVFQNQAGIENSGTARAIVEAIRAQYNGTIKALGGIAEELDAVAFVSIDSKGDAQTQLQIAAAINGQTVFDRRAQGEFENVGRTEEELEAAIKSASNRAVLAALQASDLPEKIKNFLGTAGDIESLVQTSAAIIEIDKVFTRLGGNLSKLVNLSVETELSFISQFSDIQTLGAKLESYFQSFYSEAERFERASLLVQQSFRDLNSSGIFQDTQALFDKFATTGTRASFRDLIEAQDLTTESGRKAYAALLNIADAFAEVTVSIEESGIDKARKDLIDSYNLEVTALENTISTFRNFANEFRKFKDSLLIGQLSTLTPAQKYAESQRQFEDVRTKALAGDKDALGQLQGASSSFLEQSRSFDPARYLVDFSRVTQTLDMAAVSSDMAADISELQLEAVKAQLQVLTGIEENTLSIAQALMNYQAAVGTDYFTANPDVASAFAANNEGLTVEQFSEIHFERYGQFEGREAPSDSELVNQVKILVEINQDLLEEIAAMRQENNIGLAINAEATENNTAVISDSVSTSNFTGTVASMATIT